ncbi:unnamed protein product [Candidula unifasciata]|uniref:UspA domain-containing protein n=1 Tax=Candidula unifasciata TaxID=100452 RepID=A0A8S3Z1S2_9EUPU|nr:unnamed protein product [Candidula unifasciata]
MSTPPRKILIAMDGSKHSDYAFDWYVKYFYKDKDDVLIAYCSEHAGLLTAPFQAPASSAVSRMVREEEMDSASALSQFQKKLQNAGIKGNVIRLSGGKPGEVIVKASEEHKVDMIITGTRGLGTIRRTLMGSVSQYVVHHASCPVLVVRQ